MDQRPDSQPSIGPFWEQADHDGSGDNPYARELEDCIDTAHRYWRLYADADESGREEEAGILLAQYEEAQAKATMLRGAMRRYWPRR